MNRKAMYIVLAGGMTLLLGVVLHFAASSGQAPWWGFSEHFVKTTSNLDMTGGAAVSEDYYLVASCGGESFESGFSWFGPHRNYAGYLYTLGDPEFIDVIPGDIDPYFGSPDFFIQVLPKEQIVIHPEAPMKGTLLLTGGYTETATYMVWVTSLHGFSAPVYLSIPNLCCDVLTEFDPNPITPPQGGAVSSVLTMKASSTTAMGTYPFIVLGMDETGVLHHTDEMRLRVMDKPDFDFSVLQDVSQTTQRGATLVTIYVTSLLGFNQPVFLSVSGLPVGVTPMFFMNPITPIPNSRIAAVLTLQSSMAASLGEYTVTVTGLTANPGNHSDSFTLCIEESGAEPEIAVSIDPPVSIVKPDSHFTVCLHTDDLSGLMVSTLYGEISFDTSVIVFDSTINFNDTCLDSLGWDLKWHYKDGALDTLQFWLIGGGHASEGIECEGCLIELGFWADSLAYASHTSHIHIEEVVFDGAPFHVVTEDGIVIINRPPVILTAVPETLYYGETTENCLEIVAVDVDNDSIKLWTDLDPDVCDGAFEDTVQGLGSTLLEFCWKPPKHGTCDTLDIDFVAMSTHTTGQPLYDVVSTTIIARDCEVMVAWPDTAWHAGGWLEIPVRIHANYGLISDLDVTSVFLELCYNPELMSVGEVGNEGLVTEDWGALTFDVNEELGTIQVAMAGNYPLPNTGPPWAWTDVLYVGFWIDPEAEEGAGDFLCIDHVKFNEGTPYACWDDGVFTVIRHAITGNVAYCSTGVALEDVEMTLTWDVDLDGSIDSIWTTTTNDSGDYGFFHLYGSTGEYCVTPSKQGDLGIQTITSYDATLILRSMVGLITLDSCSYIAADVTGDGTVGAYDVSTLLEYVICGNCDSPPSHTGIIGTWTFFPPQLCYRSLKVDTTDQDYMAVLIGDVSGNWPGHANPKLMAGGIGIDVETHSVSFTLPEPVFSLDLTIESHDAVQPLSVGIEEAMYTWRAGDGIIRIAAASEVEFSTIRIDFADLSPAVFDISAMMNEGTIISTSAKIVLLPTECALQQNYPNPFNPTTDIGYQIVDAEPSTNTTLKIYNMLGQKVRILVDERKEPGYYTVTWDGCDDEGVVVASGVYFYRIQSGDFTASRRMVLMK